MYHCVFNRMMYENTDYVYTTVEQQTKITHIFCVKSDVYRLTLIFFFVKELQQFTFFKDYQFICENNELSTVRACQHILYFPPKKMTTTTTTPSHKFLGKYVYSH